MAHVLHMEIQLLSKKKMVFVSIISNFDYSNKNCGHILFLATAAHFGDFFYIKNMPKDSPPLFLITYYTVIRGEYNIRPEYSTVPTTKFALTIVSHRKPEYYIGTLDTYTRCRYVHESNIYKTPAVIHSEFSGTAFP